MDKPVETAIEETTKSGGRTQLNFWVDLITALLFALLLGTSLIMKFILPPGTCDIDGTLTLLGHARHWWGDIHFVAAALMIILVIVHIWLHWAWVVKTWSKFLGRIGSPATWVTLLLFVAFIFAPFAIPTEFRPVAEMAHENPVVNIPGVTDVETQGVAPCGVEGLSCSSCPAADDHLFGGSCAGSTEDTEDAPADCNTEESDCNTCSFAEQCASGTDSAEDKTE